MPLFVMFVTGIIYNFNGVFPGLYGVAM